MSNIWVAASDGKLAVVKSLIEGGLKPDVKDPNGYTPIHAAASYGHIDLLKYLCQELNGDINVQDSDGDTPLHHVEEVEIAKFLVTELKADYLKKNNDGLTPFKYQEEEGEFPDLIDYLGKLERGDDASGSAAEFGLGDEMVLPNGEKIRVELANESSLNDSEEDTEESRARKAKLQEIMESENPDDGLRDFVMESVRRHMGELKGSSNDDDDEKYKERDSKRRR